MDALPTRVEVDCYAGYQGEETPRSFTIGEQVVEVLVVLNTWRTPEHRHFRVQPSAGEMCVLRQDVRSGTWELV